jgi:hypothetical protein
VCWLICSTAQQVISTNLATAQSTAAVLLCLFQVLAENKALVEQKKQITTLKKQQEAAFVEQQRRALEVCPCTYFQQHRFIACSLAMQQQQ